MAKKWYCSKGVWLGVCMFSIGAIEIVQQIVASGDYSTLAILTAVGGVLKVAERVTSSGEAISI